MLVLRFMTVVDVLEAGVCISRTYCELGAHLSDSFHSGHAMYLIYPEPIILEMKLVFFDQKPQFSQTPETKTLLTMNTFYL